MKAFVRDAYGPPEVLELVEMATPIPIADQVLVRVHAASVNAGDLDYLYGRPLIARLATGLRRPKNRGLGLDVAGTVEAVGREVTRFRPGDEVYGDLTSYGFGAFAEYVCVPERAFAELPVGVSLEQAATLPQSAIMALQALRGRGGVQPGDSVLVNGASGNVGPFAVQIAKALGAEVTGVCSTAKMDLVRRIGADHVIDYTRQDFTRGGRRYDRILDVAARRSIFACRRSLSPDGVYVWMGGATRYLFQALLIGPILSLFGRKRLGLLWWWRPFKKSDVAFLEELVETGRVAPVIDRAFPLDEVPDALHYLEDGRARGKVTIKM